MNLLKCITSSFITALLVGCVATKINLQPLPIVNRAVAPAAPQNQNMNLVLNYPKDQTKSYRDLQENAITKGNFSVPANSRIVISVPVEQQSISANAQSEKDDNGDNVFKTAEYFNKAEQEIEKSLIRKGFTVIDRSKFEAELRERRTKEKTQYKSDSMKAAIKELDEGKDAKRITRDEYLEGLRDLESKNDIFEKGGTRTAGTKELVDIGELIRAAEKGTVQADFILQVNRFETGAISDKNIYLPSHPSLREVADKNIELIQTLEQKNYSNILQPGYFGYLNAKLIEVKTGSIVWVGEHRVESGDVEDITVQLDIQKVPANLSEIQNTADRFNLQLRDLASKSAQESAIIVNENLENEVRKSAEAQYYSYSKQLSALQPDNVQYPQWTYKYEISRPRVTPQFPSLRDLELLEKKGEERSSHNEFLRLKNYAIEHQSTLVKEVSKMLIGTIPASE